MESQPIKAELLRVDCVYLCTQPVTFLFETAAHKTTKQENSPLERETENDGLWQFSRPEVIFSMQKLSHTMCIYPKIHHTQQNNTHISNNVKCWLLLFICCKMQKPIQRNVGLSDNHKISLVYTLSVLCTS